MTTPTNTPLGHLADLFRRVGEGWTRFWFTPADPTVLGVIRIACGVVMLYIHLISTPHLQALYGPDGWMDLSTANLLRRETPWQAPPDEWDRDPRAFSCSWTVRSREPGSSTWNVAGFYETQEQAAAAAAALARKEIPVEVVPPLPAARPEITDPALISAYQQRWGFDPRAAIDQGQEVFSFWYHITHPSAMMVAHGLALLVMLLFTLGLWTRVTSVLAWGAALSYIHRASNTLFGQDTMLAILLVYLMIGPSGAALSLDRLIARLRQARRAPRGSLPPPGPSVSANFAIRLLQLHFCIIYLASGTSKLQGGAWWNGTAIWQTLSNYEFAGPRSALMTSLLYFLAGHRWLWEIGMSAGTLFTLMLEIGLPFLIWVPRCRWVCITGAILLHTGIALGMGLVGFSLLMLCIVLAFVPAPVIHEMLDGLGRSRQALAAWLFRPRREAERQPAVARV